MQSIDLSYRFCYNRTQETNCVICDDRFIFIILVFYKISNGLDLFATFRSKKLLSFEVKLWDEEQK